MNKIMNHEQLKSIGLYWSTFLDAFLARLADEGDDRLQVGYILTVKSAATASFECATTPLAVSRGPPNRPHIFLWEMKMPNAFQWPALVVVTEQNCHVFPACETTPGFYTSDGRGRTSVWTPSKQTPGRNTSWPSMFKWATNSENLRPVTIENTGHLASALLWLHASLKTDRFAEGVELLHKQNLPIDGHDRCRRLVIAPPSKKNLDAARILYLLHMIDMLLPDVAAMMVDMTERYKIERERRVGAKQTRYLTL